MATRWRVFVRAGLPENVYFEMQKRLRIQRTTINDYLNRLVMKDLGLKEKSNLPPEQKEELSLSMKNHINAEARKQIQVKNGVIARKKPSGMHYKKPNHTEDDRENLFTRATKTDF